MNDLFKLMVEFHSPLRNHWIRRIFEGEHREPYELSLPPSLEGAAINVQTCTGLSAGNQCLSSVWREKDETQVHPEVASDVDEVLGRSEI